jgi:proline iminopeptidase
MALDPVFFQRIKAHAALYHSDPEAAHEFAFGDPKVVYPACLLTTKGRKTGNLIDAPLIYAKDGANVILVASLGGAPQNPSWYENLAVNPEATVQIKRDKWAVRARTVEGPERERLWKIAAGVFPPYNDYQARTERRIPVVLLEPA